jgi:hypothetical protein
MLVHLEHLLPVEIDREEDDSHERDEYYGAPRIGQGPEFEFRKIGGE